MNSKQRAYLRSLANTLTPIFQIGKSGITENQVKSICDALEANELIKINVLKNTNDDITDIANTLVTQTQSEIIQIMGNKITLYKESKNKKRIELPK